MRVIFQEMGMVNRVNSLKFKMYRTILGQCVVIVLVAGFWLIAGIGQMASAFLGGLVCVLPNILFIEIFFRNWRKKKASQIMASFYLGELTKLILTGGLAVGVVSSGLPLHLLPFMVGLLAAYMGLWVVGGFVMLRKSR